MYKASGYQEMYYPPGTILLVLLGDIYLRQSAAMLTLWDVVQMDTPAQDCWSENIQQKGR